VPTNLAGDAHGGCEANTCYEIRMFVDAHKLGKVRVGEVGIYVARNPDTVRGADAIFISHERYAQKRSNRSPTCANLLIGMSCRATMCCRASRHRWRGCSRTDRPWFYFPHAR
jgi:hypothetical protein